MVLLDLMAYSLTGSVPLPNLRLEQFCKGTVK